MHRPHPRDDEVRDLMKQGERCERYQVKAAVVSTIRSFILAWELE